VLVIGVSRATYHAISPTLLLMPICASCVACFCCAFRLLFAVASWGLLGNLSKYMDTCSSVLSACYCLDMHCVPKSPVTSAYPAHSSITPAVITGPMRQTLSCATVELSTKKLHSLLSPFANVSQPSALLSGLDKNDPACIIELFVFVDAYHKASPLLRTGAGSLRSSVQIYNI
jgi:hypothetical protein